MVPGKNFELLFKWLFLRVGLIICFATLFATSFQITDNRNIYYLYIVICMAIGLGYLFYKCFKKGPHRHSARLLGGSFIIFLSGVFFDIWSIVTGTSFVNILPYFFMFLILMQSGIISGKSAYAYKQTILLSANLQEKNKEITFFNQNLERLVDEKTREVKGLLDHIPQGVMTIDDGGLIGKNFSAHLAEVIGHSDVAEKQFNKVILEKSTMTFDDQDQAWQAILNSVQELDLNYDVNCDKFPNQIEYTHDGITKILGVTWSPQVNDGFVESILVTLLDVTAEKKLEAEARKQQKEMTKISELLALPEAKAHNFFSTSFLLLNEIRETLSKENVIVDEERVKLLFVNAHTVKGSARTLDLSELTEVIHLMEQRYSHVLRKTEEVDVQAMRDDIEIVFKVYDDYKNVNTEKLNRNAESNYINIERNLIEKTFYLIKSFVNGSDADEKSFKPAFQDQGDILAKLIFEDLTMVFEDYRERVIKIASDTGREKPETDFQVPATVISSDQREVLDMTMIHLLRNALDHGIEKKEDRLSKGKNPSGRLAINVDITQDVLTMTVEDDGKGIPIKSLREKGLKTGNLTDKSPLSEIAETIFQSGTSTAEAVTDISGRGVGMDAVRRMLEKAGGSIKIILGEEKNDGSGNFGFHFKIILPLAQIILDKKASHSIGDDEVA